MEITSVRKYQIWHTSYHLIPNILPFKSACALHICKEWFPSLSLFPPHPSPSLLHMGLTYDPRTSNAIAWPDLCCTNQLCLESQTEKEIIKDGDGECTTADFFQKNPEQIQIWIAFLVICLACLGGMIMTVLSSRGSWSLDIAWPSSGNPMYYRTKE